MSEIKKLRKLLDSDKTPEEMKESIRKRLSILKKDKIVKK